MLHTNFNGKKRCATSAQTYTLDDAHTQVQEEEVKIVDKYQDYTPRTRLVKEQENSTLKVCAFNLPIADPHGITRWSQHAVAEAHARIILGLPSCMCVIAVELTSQMSPAEAHGSTAEKGAQGRNRASD